MLLDANAELRLILHLDSPLHLIAEMIDLIPVKIIEIRDMRNDPSPEVVSRALLYSPQARGLFDVSTVLDASNLGMSTAGKLVGSVCDLRCSIAPLTA